MFRIRVSTGSGFRVFANLNRLNQTGLQPVVDYHMLIGFRVLGLGFRVLILGVGVTKALSLNMSALSSPRNGSVELQLQNAEWPVERSELLTLHLRSGFTELLLKNFLKLL